MTKVAVATCRGENVDPDSAVLLAALSGEGVTGELRVWDDPEVQWSDYELVVLRSTWDYAARRDEFLAWARSVPRLANPYEVVVYSSDKHYLADLANRGVSVVPSTFCDVGETPTFPDVNFVVKPCVGAGSIDADRYGAHEHARARAHVARLHDQGRDVLIQPYVESVDVLGERALVFVDGTFSHAMTKGAMLNVAPEARDVLFRREQMSVAQGEPDALELAHAAFAGAGFTGLLYGRVDVVYTPAGWALMELELVEPSLFLSYDARAATRLARAIRSRLR